MLARVVGIQDKKVQLQDKVVDLLLDKGIDTCSRLVIATKKYSKFHTVREEPLGK